MLKVVLFILAMSSAGQPFQAQVPVSSVQECVEKGSAWASQDPAAVSAKQLGFACVVTDERPQA